MLRPLPLLVLGVLAATFASAQTSTSLGRPLAFEPNRGQADSQVLYLSHGSRSVIAIEGDSVMVTYRNPSSQRSSFNSLRLTFIGANPRLRIATEGKLPGIVNYLIGKDPSKWQTNLPTFSRVRYQALYPGVDAIFYGKEGSLEYDLVVAPHASSQLIQLRFDQRQAPRIATNGDLVLKIGGSELREHRPTVYQVIGGHRRPVQARFLLRADRTVGFDVGSYDHAQELIIDPTLVYSTLIGTTYINNVLGVAVDGNGNAYATGYTYYNFPTKNAFEGNQPSEDAFVTKFSATGGSLVYSTYLGGSGSIDEGTAIGVDRFGSAYVVGGTNSSNFPVTPGAIQATLSGGRADAFATKLSPSGSSLVYSTYLGGSGDDFAKALAIDSQHRLYVTGYTCSSNFPVANAFQPTSGTGFCSKPTPGPNAFVTRFNAAGTGLDYSTYLGGNTSDGATGITVDSTYHAYVTGGTSSPNFPTTPGAFQRTLPSSNSPFVTKFAPDGKSLVFSTFVGGSTSDSAYAIAIDGYDRPYITGVTSSTDFPVTSGAFQKTPHGSSDAFVTKLWKTGGGLIYSAYLGGSGLDVGNSIAVDSRGEAYVAGYTSSTNFPVQNALQSTEGGNSDGFITKLSATGGSLIFSTYIGGSGSDTANSIRLDGSGNVYVGGSTNSTNFRTTAGAYQKTLKGSSDGWVVKVKP